MSRKPRDPPPPGSSRGTMQGRGKGQLSNASKQRAKRPKPLDVQLLIDEAIGKSQSEVIARSALQHIIDVCAKKLFDNHVQRIAIDRTATETVGAIFEATRFCLLKHDVGERDSKFPPATTAAHVPFVNSSASEENDLMCMNPGLARMNRLRMLWDDAPTQSELQRQASPEYVAEEEKKCTREPVTTAQQSWVCEPPPPPCAEDRWSRGLVPIHEGSISSHYKALNSKFSETLLRKQQLEAAVAQASRAATTPTSAESQAQSPTATSGAGRHGRRASLAGTSSLGQAQQQQHENGSAGQAQENSEASTLSWTTSSVADALSLQSASLRGTDIDLRHLPSDSPLFWKTSTDGETLIPPSNPPVIRRRASVALSDQPQQQQHSNVPQPFHCAPVVSQHKLEEERLREIALKALNEEKRLKAIQAEVDRRLASEAAKFSAFRSDLRDKEFTLGRTGAVVLIKGGTAGGTGISNGAKTSRLHGAPGSTSSRSANDAVPSNAGTAAIPSTCPTISTVHVSVQNPANQQARTSSHSFSTMRRAATLGARTEASQNQVKDTMAAAAMQASAAAIKMLAASVDASAVQPSFSQTLQPAPGVTMKQGSVVKVGPKRQSTAPAVPAAGGSTAPSPYTNMTRSQYLSHIQSLAPAAAPLPLHASTATNTSSVGADAVRSSASASQGSALSTSDNSSGKSAMSSSTSQVKSEKQNSHSGAADIAASMDDASQQAGSDRRAPGSSVWLQASHQGSPSCKPASREVEPVEYDPKGKRLAAQLHAEAHTSRKVIQEAIKARQREVEEEATLALSARPVNVRDRSKPQKSGTGSEHHPSPRSVVEALANEPGRGIVPYGKQQPIRTRERKPPLSVVNSGHKSSGILQTAPFGTITSDSLDSRGRLYSSDPNEPEIFEFKPTVSLRSVRDIRLPYRHVVAGLHAHPLPQAQARAASPEEVKRLGLSSTLASSGRSVFQDNSDHSVVEATSLVKQFFGPKSITTSTTGATVSQ